MLCLEMFNYVEVLCGFNFCLPSSCTFLSLPMICQFRLHNLLSCLSSDVDEMVVSMHLMTGFVVDLCFRNMCRLLWVVLLSCTVLSLELKMEVITIFSMA